MAWDAQGEVLKREFASGHEKLVAVLLANHANEHFDYEVWTYDRDFIVPTQKNRCLKSSILYNLGLSCFFFSFPI